MEPALKIIAPGSGHKLERQSPNLFSDGMTQFPYIDGILYLRGKPEFRDEAVALIERNNIEEARALLLRDQDDFSTNIAPPVAEIVKYLEDAPDSLSKMMAFLNYGGVADYFSARWSSPTFVAGLALLQNILAKDRIHIEIACGIGQFLRIVENNGIDTIGIDVVFSKLWLARKYLGLKGTLICSDITEDFKFGLSKPASVHCQDALYFLEDKKSVLEKMRKFSKDTVLGVGHCHTELETEYSNGFPLPLTEYETLAAADSNWFTDETLIKAWLYDTALSQSDTEEVLAETKAVSWIEGRKHGKNERYGQNKESKQKGQNGNQPDSEQNQRHGQNGENGENGQTEQLFKLKSPQNLCINPMIDTEDLSRINWPSESYRDEYIDNYGYFLEPVERLTTKEEVFANKEFHYKNRILIEDITP